MVSHFCQAIKELNIIIADAKSKLQIIPKGYKYVDVRLEREVLILLCSRWKAFFDIDSEELSTDFTFGKLISLNIEAGSLNSYIMYTWILLACISVLLTICVVYYFKHKTISLNYLDKNIPKFSSDIVFNDTPSEVDISNQFDCNVMSLRECQLDDPTSVMGCKEFTARCHNFAVDTKMEYGGKEYLIPANKDSNTGYALVLDTITEDCNPYHGDLVLVTSDPSRNAYTLLCECKQPGFIGNDTILGNCSTIRICNGKIDNLNQPFEDIQCICDKTKYSNKMTNGAPVCTTLTVAKANQLYADWTDLLSFDGNTIAKNAFSIDIAGNLNISKMLDPCSTDILSGKEAVGAEYSETLKSCTVTDPKFIFPITNTHLADNKESINYVLSANFNSIFWISTVGSVISSFGGKGSIPSIESLPNYKIDSELNPIYMFKDPVAINHNYNPLHGTQYTCPRVECSGTWPTYNCYYNSGHAPIMTKCGIPVADRSEAPGTFPWGADSWGEAESLFTEPSIICNVVHDSGTPTAVDYEKFNAITSARFPLSKQLGSVFVYSDSGTDRQIAFSSNEVFQLQVENITPIQPDA
jgi:hypothetical protein